MHPNKKEPGITSLALLDFFDGKLRVPAPAVFQLCEAGAAGPWGLKGYLPFSFSGTTSIFGGSADSGGIASSLGFSLAIFS